MVANSRRRDTPASRDLELLMVIVTGLLVFIMAARTPIDTDFWWHIRAGEETWRTGKPLLTDQFTFTRAGQPWNNHSWLAEVILYLVFRTGGYLGISVLVAFLAAGSMLLVYAQLDGPALLKSAIIILASLVAAPVWSPRPQLFSLFLFAGLYLLLARFRLGGSRRLWMLPVIFLVWSNIHAGYTLGFILLGVVLLGEMLNRLLPFEVETRKNWRELRILLAWVVICLLVVLINPNGLETWWAPFKTVSMRVLQASIDEWASPDFHQFYLQPFLWLLFAVLASIGLSGRRVIITDLIGVIGFAYLAFLAKRNIAPFALFSAPVLSRYLMEAYRSWTNALSNENRSRTLRKIESKPISPGLRKTLNLCLVFLLSIGAVGKVVAVTQPVYVESAMEETFPVGAVRLLQNGHNPGNIFNSYDWGGYLEWHLRGFPVFIDGRTDLFGDEIAGQWVNTIQAEKGWEDVFSTLNIRYCLIRPNRPLAAELKNAGAKVLFEDQNSILFGLQTE